MVKTPENKQMQAVMTPFEAKNFEKKSEENGDFGYFEGYAAVFNNKDLYDDVIIKGAFSTSLAQKTRYMLAWQHDVNDVIGSILEAREDDYGLYVKGRINLGTQLGKDAYALLKAGDMEGMSIGYYVTDYDYDPVADVRYIKSIKLMEVSIVSMPANTLATVNEIKGLQAIDEAKSLRDIEKILSAKGFSKQESTVMVSKIKGFASKSQSESDDLQQGGQSESGDGEQQLQNAFGAGLRAVLDELKH